eukprot:15329501-Ditylum_brightwellii.AAC.1
MQEWAVGKILLSSQYLYNKVIQQDKLWQTFHASSIIVQFTLTLQSVTMPPAWYSTFTAMPPISQHQKVAVN